MTQNYRIMGDHTYSSRDVLQDPVLRDHALAHWKAVKIIICCLHRMMDYMLYYEGGDSLLWLC